jgi:hypothetical protein
MFRIICHIPNLELLSYIRSNIKYFDKWKTHLKPNFLISHHHLPNHLGGSGVYLAKMALSANGFTSS